MEEWCVGGERRAEWEKKDRRVVRWSGLRGTNIRTDIEWPRPHGERKSNRLG